MNWDALILSICCIGMIGCGVGLIRNQRVYRWRMMRLVVASFRSNQKIFAGKPGWEKEYDSLDTPSYSQMMWDWSKWSFSAFYPDIQHDEIKAACAQWNTRYVNKAYL